MFNRIFRFYKEGFLQMPAWGKKMWLIILVKLFIMFAILKVFFFNNHLNSNFSSDKEKGNHVIEELTNRNNNTQIK